MARFFSPWQRCSSSIMCAHLLFTHSSTVEVHGRVWILGMDRGTQILRKGQHSLAHMITLHRLMLLTFFRPTPPHSSPTCTSEGITRTSERPPECFGAQQRAAALPCPRKCESGRVAKPVHDLCPKHKRRRCVGAARGWWRGQATYFTRPCIEEGRMLGFTFPKPGQAGCSIWIQQPLSSKSPFSSQ